MSWHTKYRPRAVSELHLNDVRELLLKLMKSGQFPQVFLCAGPKGTGKTSTARIIGAMLNDPANAAAVEAQFGAATMPKSKHSSLVEPDPTSELSESIFAGESFVVQELDAASNRGIDDIRQLKERAMLPPQGARVTVYILDEVHMLTTEAFNALLKLLEEPPKHAVFVLATTELHKVPATIQSRCTILPFHKASLAELELALKKVVTAEKIEIDATALQVVALNADGSFRDAIKALEILVASADGSQITTELANQVLNTGFIQQLPGILNSVVTKDEKAVVTQIEELRSRGVSSAVVVKAILSYLHQDLLISLGLLEGEPQFKQRVSHFLLQELQTIPSNLQEPIPLLALELKLLDLLYRSKERSSGAAGSGTSGSSSTAKKSTRAVSTAQSNAGSVEALESSVKVSSLVLEEKSNPEVFEASAVEVLPEEEVANVVPVSHIDTQPLLTAWADFVVAVEQRNSTLGAFLRSAKPLIDQSNGIAKVEVYYKFHRDQLMLPRFIDVLQQCAEPMLGGKPGFEFVLATPQETVAESALM